MNVDHVRELLTEPVYERAVISHILKDADNYYDVLSKIDSSDLLHPRHAVIFSTLGKMSKEGVQHFDVPLLANELDKNGDLQFVGGVDYLESLNNFQITSTNIELSIKQVQEASTKLKLYSLLNSSQAAVVARTHTSEELIGSVENSILDMSVKSRSIAEPQLLSDGLEEYIQNRRDNPVEMSGISTGYPILDNQIDGLIPGTLTVVAARKKAGKSALLTNIALHIALKEHKPTLYIDTEMSFNEWRDRALAAISGVDERIIKHGGFKSAVYDKLMIYGLERIKKGKIFHENMPSYSVDKVTALFKKYKYKEDLGFAVFDYIKEPSSASADRNRAEHQVLGDVTTRLKDLANELNIPFLTAVQLNRANDVADSDRVARYGDVVAFWQPKTPDEMKEQIESGVNRGSHRLVIRDSRRGGQTPEEGIEYNFKKSILRIEEQSPDKQTVQYGNKSTDGADEGYADGESIR